MGLRNKVKKLQSLLKDIQIILDIVNRVIDEALMDNYTIKKDMDKLRDSLNSKLDKIEKKITIIKG